MKCGILTFYFAHNYGAVLQAFALKKYISEIGHSAAIIDYIPKKQQREYTLNPLAKGCNVKAVIKRTARIPRRLKQFMLFNTFIKRTLSPEAGQDDYDAVIFGSDQIWNEEITGEIANYYGSSFSGNVRKIAYAASFGTSELSEFQKKCIREYLPLFDAIALREKDLVKQTEKLSKIETTSVVDPVFLLPRAEWEHFAGQSQCKEENYILYYALRNDPALIKKTEELACEMGFNVVCIHPTCNDLNVKWRQLWNVGPYEFVDLIRNAAYIATNSFHAMAFSVIFGKKALYKAYSTTESRVPSLLSICGIHDDVKSVPMMFDFAEIDRNNLDAEIQMSKDFLVYALEGSR